MRVVLEVKLRDLLRWTELKCWLSISDFHDFEVDRNRSRDFAGNRERMSVTTSRGR